MNCQGFDLRLDALLDGRCTADQWCEADAHLAGCARCARLFEAMAGRADDLDDEGHETLSAAIVSKTSGNQCASARERLCDFVDRQLVRFDQELMDAHLARCPRCTSLAAALAESTRLLPSFAELAPREGIVRDVLAATSRRQADATFGAHARPSRFGSGSTGLRERVSAWIARVAQRPRFSFEVAYVLTLLLLVVFGNPVVAFRDASARVQPHVRDVAHAVSRPLANARKVGANTLASVERAIRPNAGRANAGPERSVLAEGGELLYQWWQAHVVAPFWSVVSEARDVAGRVFDALGRAAGVATAEPTIPAVR